MPSPTALLLTLAIALPSPSSPEPSHTHGASPSTLADEHPFPPPVPVDSPDVPWADILLPRSELPEDKNALLRWRAAFPSLYVEDPAVGERLIDLGSPLASIDPEADAALVAWLDATAADRAAFSLRPGESFQLPRIEGPDTAFPDHAPLRTLANVRLVAAKAAWAAGRRDETLALLLANLDLALAILRAQDGLIALIQCSGIWQIALDGVYWFAGQPDASPDACATLQAALHLHEGLAADALDRGLRGEFTFIIKSIVDRFPDTRDPELFLSAISTLSMHPVENPPAGEPRLAIPEKSPFDRHATLTAAAADLRVYLAAFARSSRHPHGLALAHTLPWLESYAQQIQPLLAYASYDGIPPPELIAETDRVIAEVPNAIGKLFLIYITSPWEKFAVSLNRREAQRSALLGLLAWRRHGQPATWDALIEAGILPIAPADPFDDGPLRLDLDPPRIWSVGENRTDEGGRGDGENYGQPDDLAWPMIAP